MTDYVLSGEAAADLDGLTRYGAARFGVRVGAKYARNILNSLELAALFPKAAVTDTTADGRRFRRRDIRSHAAFYLDRADHILVVRILHQAMDFDRYL